MNKLQFNTFVKTDPVYYVYELKNKIAIPAGFGEKRQIEFYNPKTYKFIFKIKKNDFRPRFINRHINCMIQLKNLDLTILAGDSQIFIYEIYDKSYSFINCFCEEYCSSKLIKSINGNLISFSKSILIYNKKNENSISKFKNIFKNLALSLMRYKDKKNYSEKNCLYEIEIEAKINDDYIENAIEIRAKEFILITIGYHKSSICYCDLNKKNSKY